MWYCSRLSLLMLLCFSASLLLLLPLFHGMPTVLFVCLGVQPVSLFLCETRTFNDPLWFQETSAEARWLRPCSRRLCMIRGMATSSRWTAAVPPATMSVRILTPGLCPLARSTMSPSRMPPGNSVERTLRNMTSSSPWITQTCRILRR